MLQEQTSIAKPEVINKPSLSFHQRNAIVLAGIIIALISWGIISNKNKAVVPTPSSQIIKVEAPAAVSVKNIEEHSKKVLKVVEKKEPSSGLHYRRTGPTTLMISWKPAGEAVKYHVYISNNPQMKEPSRLDTAPLDTPWYEWTNATNGDYWFGYTTIGDDGRQSDMSNPLHIKVK